MHLADPYHSWIPWFESMAMLTTSQIQFTCKYHQEFVMGQEKVDVTKVEDTVIADVKPEVTEAEGFFHDVLAKIHAEVSAVETEAEKIEAAVQAKIDAFVAGIKAKLQALHSGS
jgi:hypothetical protein